ncbi:hypothetical protein DM02DRAFT_731539, partial [Periconia macrospinosa]
MSPATPPSHGRQRTPTRGSDRPSTIARAGSTTTEAITLSDSEASDEAPHSSLHPIGDLMQTTVTLEYGPKLKGRCILHLAMLINHSNKLTNIFAKADSGHRELIKAKAMRKKVKQLLPPLTPEDQFNDTKARELIETAIKKFPMPRWQEGVKKALTNFVDQLFKDNKNLDDPHIQRRDFPINQVLLRLEQLKPAAVLRVLQRLNEAFTNIKKNENDEAVKDPIKAAKYKRILLPQAEAETIKALTEWVYHQKLNYKDADRLCKIWLLAKYMGLDDLATLSFKEFYNGYCSSIVAVQKNEISLYDLLHRPPIDGDPFSDVVPTVFQFVLRDANAPKELQEFVITALVDSVDNGDMRALELILPGMISRDDLKDTLCREVATRFIQFKQSVVDACIKQEDKSNPGDQPMKEAESDAQSSDAAT